MLLSPVPFYKVLAWDNGTQGQFQRTQLRFSVINLPQIYLVAINELVARILMLIVVGGLLIAAIVVFLHIGRQYAWINRIVLNAKKRFQWVEQLVLRLDHVMVLVVTIACILLQLFFGSDVPIIPSSSSTQGIGFTLSQVTALVLVLAVIIALFRLSRPFNWLDRLIVFVDAITCIPLLFSGQTNFLPYVQQWIATPHIALPAQFVAIGLFVAALVSLTWLKLPFLRGNQGMLLTIFGIVLVCALLQSLNYTFALVALIMLIQGVLLATQVERVR